MKSKGRKHIGFVRKVVHGNSSRATEPSEATSEHPERASSIVSVNLDFVEQLIEKLLRGNQDGRLEGLRYIVELLNCTGGEVGLMTEFGEPNLLFRYGEVQRILFIPEIYEFYTGLWGRKELVGQCIGTTIPSDARFACCAFIRSEREVLGVDVWRSAPIAYEDLTILRIFMRVLNRSLPYSRESEPPREAGYTNTAPKNFPQDYIVGQSAASILLHHELETFSSSNLPILLVGETGVGKELLARLIHTWSDRAHRPFVAVNCAAIPAELLEAEMFGIGKGVATGVQEREGYFQKAQGGTLFLDEIGEMSAPLQAKLLRALQGKEIQQVGGATLIADIRFIAATNSDLQQQMREHHFRSDLYYRIAGAVVRVPPLRERREDITQFVQHFADVYATESGKLIKGITIWALEWLTNYHWPGNIRELAHEVRRLVYLCPHGKAIEAGLLSERIKNPKQVQADENATFHDSLLIEPHIEELERNLIREALAQAKGNQSRAAQLLGISRNGLAIKMARLRIKPNIDPPPFTPA